MTEPQRLPLQDAAAELGITPDALRQRLRRGQYRSEKSEGRLYVYLNIDRTVTEQDVHLESDTLISELRAHMADLRTQLGHAHERDRENRWIIVALTQRIPELSPPAQEEASQELRESPETPPVKPEREEPTEQGDLEIGTHERAEPEMVEHRLATAEAQEDGAQRTSASARAKHILPVLVDLVLIMMVLIVVGLAFFRIMVAGSL
jgi:hypothetical protein